MQAAKVQPQFRPRRLGHVNLWVSDLERSIRFYEEVCGLELVRRERDILIAFHSNGNSHHDIGIIEISRGKDRYGRNGMLQIPKARGLKIGLNHLGWEMENEKDLVDAYSRAKACGFPVERTLDHVISHSVYVSDPDGNGHEFYADEMRDWRRIYNLDVEDEVTALWDPLAKPPKQDANYNVDAPIRKVAAAPIHPSHLIGARFATRNYEAMKNFFVSVGGLEVVSEIATPRRQCALAGSLGRADVTLTEAGDSEPTGLRSFRFRLDETIDPAPLAKKLQAAGVDAGAGAGTGSAPSLVIHDPDGFEIEFQHGRFS